MNTSAPGADLDFDAWAQRFALLADRTRLALLAHIHHAGPGNASVAELADRCGITRNAASQALRKLREQQWIIAERGSDGDARTVHYALADDTVHTVLHSLMGASHDHAHH